MPASTRSQIINSNHGKNRGPDEDQRTRPRLDQGDTHMRNPHHGLKEKMKALTLLYEQQRQATATLKDPTPNPEETKFSTHPRVDLFTVGRREEKQREESKSKPVNHVMKENAMPNTTLTRNYVLPRPMVEEDLKENNVVGHGRDRIVGFSCARRASAVARKLSMGRATGPYFMPKVTRKENAQELDCGSSEGSRILVFVRLRPMAKKETEGGARCCVKIVNKRDVYLTEFANENDYLRLKRLRGRHFTFDASFPESTPQ